MFYGVYGLLIIKHFHPNSSPLQLAMGLKLHHVKALPKVDELFDKNWVSAIVFEIISIYSF